MTKYVEVAVGELFKAVNGSAKFVKAYIEANPGEFPVYSASLEGPFGFVDDFKFDGEFLTWVMNGYGGRVQQVSGRFCVNRDRGVLVPRENVQIPDLSYLQFVLEPQLVAAAVGRRVDGRRNEYTKIYPESAEQVVVQLPLNAEGNFDYVKMAELGAKFRRIEAAKTGVRNAHDALLRAAFVVEAPEPSEVLSLADNNVFALSIGDRVLRLEHTPVGIPAYSANVLLPFGTIPKSNLSDFQRPSLIWGIDGNFDWNFIEAQQEFATTDHCGRLQILDDDIDPKYVYWFLKLTRGRYGFDRIYRASLGNVRAEVTVTLPLDPISHGYSLKRQQALADKLSVLEKHRLESLTALDDVLKVQVAPLV